MLEEGLGEGGLWLGGQLVDIVADLGGDAGADAGVDGGMEGEGGADDVANLGGGLGGVRGFLGGMEAELGEDLRDAEDAGAGLHALDPEGVVEDHVVIHVEGAGFFPEGAAEEDLRLDPLAGVVPDGVDIEELLEGGDVSSVVAGYEAVDVDPLDLAIYEVDVGVGGEGGEDRGGGGGGEEVVAIDEADDVAAHLGEGVVEGVWLAAVALGDDGVRGAGELAGDVRGAIRGGAVLEPPAEGVAL